MSDPKLAMGKHEPAIAAVAIALFSCLLLMPSIRGHDGVGNYVYLVSLLTDGDLDFSDEYRAYDSARDTPYKMADEPVSPETGRPANRYGIGAALFWAPAVFLVHGLLLMVAPELASGMTDPYAWAVGASSAWWGGLGLWLLYVRLRESHPLRIAVMAAAGIFIATPLAFYTWAHGSMSHAVSFFIAVCAMLTFERTAERPTATSCLLLGFWSGLLVLVRIQDVTWAGAIGLSLLVVLVRARTADNSPKVSSKDSPENSAKVSLANAALYLLLFAVAALATMTPQMAVWGVLYGNPLSGPLPYLGREGGGFSFVPIHLWGVLMSERGGFLAWHPILLLGVVGLFVRGAAKGNSKGDFRRSSLWMPAVLGLAVQVYLLAGWSMWWGGASFGNRFFISSYPYLALGLASVLARWDRRRAPWVLPAVLGAFILWNCGLMVQYGTEMISREDEVGWLLVLRNQFVDVPRWLFSRFF